MYHDKLAAFALAFLMLAGFAAGACTGVYVGKKVSADGSTLIARTVDDWSMAFWHFCTVVPHRVTDEPVVYRGAMGFTRAWPRETYKYVCTPRGACFESGRFASLAMNEKGLAITGTVTAWPKHALIDRDPYVKTGATEESVPEYLIACSASAREAVENLGAILRENGNAEGNIYMFADPKEAWYVETYTGHHWVAVRMPEDKVAAFGNQYMLGEVDLASPDTLTSPGFGAFLESSGCIARGPGGRIHLAETCGAKQTDFCNMRTWWGRVFFAPGSVGEYVTAFRHEHFFTPAKKVAPADVFRFFRSRYEGTPYCPETCGRADIKFVGSENQENEHVLSIRDDLPAASAITAWTALGPCDHSVFFPISNAATSFEPDWSADSPAGAKWGYRDETGAANRIRKLATLARLDRVRYGEPIRAYWQRLERKYAKEWPETVAKAHALGDPAKTAAALTDYTRACQREIGAATQSLIDQLMAYMLVDVRTCRWHPAPDGYGIVPIPQNPPFEPK